VARRRSFGEIERRASGTRRVTYRARYAMPDGTRYSRTFGAKVDAEAWLAAESSLIDREQWTPPQARKAAQERREAAAASNTVSRFVERYLAERELRPNTLRLYRQLLRTRILPHLGDRSLETVTVSDIKRWRLDLPPNTGATNAAAYRLLRSLMQAAEEEELIVRTPPRIRGAGSARVKRKAKPATLDELAIIVEHVPDRLRLLIQLAAFVGLREVSSLSSGARTSTPQAAGSRSPARWTRTSFLEPRTRALGVGAGSARPRRPAAYAPSTFPHRSSPCWSATCWSTARRGLTGCCSPVSGPTT